MPSRAYTQKIKANLVLVFLAISTQANGGVIDKIKAAVSGDTVAATASAEKPYYKFFFKLGGTVDEQKQAPEFKSCTSQNQGANSIRYICPSVKPGVSKVIFDTFKNRVSFILVRFDHRGDSAENIYRAILGQYGSPNSTGSYVFKSSTMAEFDNGLCQYQPEGCKGSQWNDGHVTTTLVFHQFEEASPKRAEILIMSQVDLVDQQVAEGENTASNENKSAATSFFGK